MQWGFGLVFLFNIFILKFQCLFRTGKDTETRKPEKRVT